MNKVVLVGRLTRDPELKFTPGTGTAVATCTLAVDRRFSSKEGQKEADFIPVVIWGKPAENTANYMSKGSLMGVSGRIQTRTYDAKDGTKRYVTEVVADEVQFLSKGSGNTGGNAGGSGFRQSPNNDNSDSYSNPNTGFGGQDFGDDMTPVDEGDIPF